MKITQEEVVDQQTVLHIELEEEDLGSYLDRGYSRVVQRTMIPGFRKKYLAAGVAGQDGCIYFAPYCFQSSARDACW